jgi:MOSC domain-containing protein YiiM
VIGIARRPARREPMQEIASAAILTGGGVAGDHKGLKFPNRGVTVMSREAWEAALAELDGSDGTDCLPWTVRRANVLVEGVRLPRARGAVVRIGSAVLEVTYPTQPCVQMERARKGLLKALHPDWRGGITCRVVEGGTIRIHDAIEVLVSPPEKMIRLPG